MRTAPTMTTAWVDICYNERGFYLATRSGNGMSFIDENGSRFFLPQNISNYDLGIAARDCLEKSRLIPLEECKKFFDWRERKYQTDQYERWQMAAGVFKTLKSLRKNMMACSFDLEDGTIYISHSDHLKINEWAFPRNQLETEIAIPSDSSPSAIGAAVREGLKKCTGIGREDLIFPEPLPD